MSSLWVALCDVKPFADRGLDVHCYHNLDKNDKNKVIRIMILINVCYQLIIIIPPLAACIGFVSVHVHVTCTIHIYRSMFCAVNIITLQVGRPQLCDVHVNCLSSSPIKVERLLSIILCDREIVNTVSLVKLSIIMSSV